MAGEMRRAAEAWECSGSKQHEARGWRICRRSVYTIGDAGGLRAEEESHDEAGVSRLHNPKGQDALTPS